MFYLFHMEFQMAKAKVTSSKKYSAIPKPASKPVEAVAAPEKAATIVSPSIAPIAVATVKAAETVMTQPVVAKVTAPQAIVAKTVEATPPKAAIAASVALITALRDSDADIASDAAAALGTLGDKSAVEPLIEVIYNANGYFHSVVRAATACSLGQLKDVRAIDSLLFAIDDTMAEASAEAVRALATIGDRRVVGVLIDVIRNRTGFYLQIVRLAATVALAKLGGEEATAELRSIAENSWEDQIIRNAAEQASQSVSSPIKAH